MTFEVWFKRSDKLESTIYFCNNAEEARRYFYKEYGNHRIISILLGL